jgi:hypothetical protein
MTGCEVTKGPVPKTSQYRATATQGNVCREHRLQSAARTEHFIQEPVTHRRAAGRVVRWAIAHELHIPEETKAGSAVSAGKTEWGGVRRTAIRQEVNIGVKSVVAHSREPCMFDNRSFNAKLHAEAVADVFAIRLTAPRLPFVKKDISSGRLYLKIEIWAAKQLHIDPCPLPEIDSRVGDYEFPCRIREIGAESVVRKPIRIEGFYTYAWNRLFRLAI